MRRLAFAVVALGMIAVACTETDPVVDDGAVEPGSTTTTNQPPSATTSSTKGELGKPYGGTVVFVGVGDEAALESEPVVLGALASDAGWHVRRWEFDQWVPGLLTEIPSTENGLVRLNADGSMTVRYEIHPDAVWDDGTPITGSDFRFTYDFVMANFDELVDFSNELGSAPTWGKLFPEIDPESIMVEDKAFEYTLGTPTRTWVNLFQVLMPEHQVQDFDLAPWLDEAGVWYNAGPWLEAGFGNLVIGSSGWPEQIRQRNDRYWANDADTGQQLPFWDTQRWVFLPDGEQAWEYFLATPEADWVGWVVTSETIDDIISHDLIVVAQGGAFEHIAFNQGATRLEANPDSLVEHLAFRQTIAHGLDRQRIADEVYGGRIDAIDSYVTVFSPAVSQDAWNKYQYNPELARQILSDLCAELARNCAENPPTLSLSTSDFGWRPQTAQLVQKMLGDIGIEVSVDTDRTIGEIINGVYETAVFGWAPGSAGLLPLVEMHQFFGAGLQPDFYSWGFEDSGALTPTAQRFADLTAAMPTTSDDDGLTSLIEEAEQILADELVFIPLFPRGFADLWKPGRVSGPESEIFATDYAGSWESFYRVDLGGQARYEP